MQLDPSFLTVSAVAVMLVSLLLWARKRPTDLWRRYANDRSGSLPTFVLKHGQNVSRREEHSVRQSRGDVTAPKQGKASVA